MKYILYRRCAAACLALVILFTVGCMGTAPDSSAASSSGTEGEIASLQPAKRQYTIPRGDWVVDEDGVTIPKEQQFITLYSQAGEPQALMQKRNEDTGRDTEYGSPILQYLSALYDLEGNLLCDWEEIDYKGGFGDYIIRQDPSRSMDAYEEPPEGYQTGLWSISNQTMQFEGVAWVNSVGDGNVLLSDAWRRLLGRVDEKGQAIGSFPVQKNYYFPDVWGDYIIAVEDDPFDQNKVGNGTQVLLTMDDYQLVDTKEAYFGSYFNAHSNSLLMYRQSDQSLLMRMPEKEIVFTCEREDSIDYFDDELVVLNRVVDEETREWEARLSTLEGEVLAEGYQFIRSNTYDVADDRRKPATGFVGTKDGRMEMLDRKGKVITSVELPNIIDVNVLGDGLYSYYSQSEDESMSFCGVLDEQLKVVIPAGQYESIYRLNDWNSGKFTQYDLLQCGRRINQGTDSRVDILDLSGRVIIGDLTSVWDTGPNRMAIVQGFSQGLIDFEGKWIVRDTIFTDLDVD